MNALQEAFELSQSAAKAYDGVISDLRASAEGHTQDEVEHQRKNLTMSKELSDSKGRYHALIANFELEKTEMFLVRAESEEQMALEIKELKVDSDDVCGQLALSKANCGKLVEALRVAQNDAELGSNE